MNDTKTTQDLGASNESMLTKIKDNIKNKKDKKGKWNKTKRMWKQKGNRSLGKGKMFNDIQDYMKNPTIAEAFGKIPFNYIVGNRPMGVEYGIALPAIASCGLDWCVAPVNVQTDQSSVRDILNEVATIIYTNMRRHNAGSTNGIEYVDVITSNLLAGIDILANIVGAQRVFKIANSFSWKNRMIPRVLFQHLGIDYDDFIRNQANYRGQINTLIAEARTIKVLANFPFVKVLLAEYENIFKDSDTDTGREQLMIVCKYFHRIYDPVGTTNFPGGTVREMYLGDLDTAQPDNQKVITTRPFINFAGASPATRFFTQPTVRKFSTDLAIISRQIDRLITDSDFNLIQADLEKAFGEQSGYVVADAVTSDETISPVYSGEFWTMVHNGTFAPFPYKLNYFQAAGFFGLGFIPEKGYCNRIYQHHDPVTGVVKLGSQVHFFANPSQPTEQSAVAGMCDTESDNPDVSEIFAMTRYKSLYSGVSRTAIPEDFRPTDTDLTLCFVPQAQSNFILFGGFISHIYFGDPNGKVFWKYWDNFYKNDYGADTNGIPMIGFEHRPLVYGVVSRGLSDTPEINMIYNDINNLRQLTKDELFHLHETAFLSLWNLPEYTNI